MRADLLQQKLTDDFVRFASGMPDNLEEYILGTYGVSLESRYGIHQIKNPFGKASGQLSLNLQQIAHDSEAGLGFVVLKTLIAQDASGAQSMSAWAIPEARMKVERIRALREDAREKEGWTVTWKGRGWSESLEAYLRFMDQALTLGAATSMLIVPSCKFHLPQIGELLWKQSEYDYTIEVLLKIWQKHNHSPLPIEKDFSPTLAGDEHFSFQKERILDWLKQTPTRIRAAAKENQISIGLKIFNAQFEDSFQVEMIQKVIDAGDADFIIYGNRLFDPDKEFEGKRGVAYGGPDLSARNLSALQKIQKTKSMPISATGDIITGRHAFEYLKRGATSFQMHTLFQLPDSEFTMKTGTRTARALHKLLFDPNDGFLCCVLSAKEKHGWENGIAIVEIAAAMREESNMQRE